jgi:predicted RNA-binding Zn-ribbon protein involved in translation (DUF1610 family)
VNRPDVDTTSVAPAQASVQACANCGAAFQPERRRFCPECGQETYVRAPKLGEFVQQFGGAYFATEGALWRTFKLLLFKPGELTRQYLAGRRKHYVLPLRLYLTISLVTLLIVRLAGSVDVNVQPEVAEEFGKAGKFVSLSIGDGRAGLRDGVFYCENLPDWVCKRLKRRLDIDPKALAGTLEVIKDRFLGNLGSAMFLLLPAFALGLKLVYLGRRLRYTEHLVFALHVHAFWFLALAVAMSGVEWLVMVFMLAVPVYTLLAMKRVYGGRLWPRLLRAGAVSLFYGVTLTAAIVGVGAFALLF